MRWPRFTTRRLKMPVAVVAVVMAPFFAFHPGVVHYSNNDQRPTPPIFSISGIVCGRSRAMLVYVEIDVIPIALACAGLILILWTCVRAYEEWGDRPAP